MLAIKVATSPSTTEEGIKNHLTEVIDGTPLDFTDENLIGLADLARIKKVYKLNADIKGGSKVSKGVVTTDNVAKGEATAQRAQIEAWVLAAMALRGVS